MTSGAGVSDTGFSCGSMGSGVSASSFVLSLISSSDVGILAATSVMVAPAKAGCGTNESSNQFAAVTIITPFWSISNSVGFTPTLTESSTPSAAKTRASSPNAVVLIFAVNSMPSGVSSRAVTMPMACVLSWYMYSLGFLPSTGSEPGANITSVPSLTVATTL